MSLELIKKHDFATLPPKPNLEFGKPVVRVTDPFLISECIWKDQNLLNLPKLLTLPIFKSIAGISLYRHKQYWKLVKSSRGSSGMEKTFECHYKIGISQTEIRNVSQKIGIGIKYQGIQLLQAELSSKFEKEITLTEEFTYKQVSTMPFQENDWIWAIWQLIDVYEINKYLEISQILSQKQASDLIHRFSQFGQLFQNNSQYESLVRRVARDNLKTISTNKKTLIELGNTSFSVCSDSTYEATYP